MTGLSRIREAILQALPVDTSYNGGAPPQEHLYVPPTHLKALRPECQLVVGTRGVGKSVWTAALNDQALRSRLGSSIPKLDQAEIRIGFSERPEPDRYPDAATLDQLMKAGAEPYAVWRAVVVRWLAELLGEHIPCTSWQESVEWVSDNPERVAQMVILASEQLNEEQKDAFILFDALDRLSSDWHIMDEVVRDLLRVALWLKPYPRIFAKIFLRDDQLERTVTNFPDASKLLATKAELSWARHDLHGLLWQYFLNGPNEHGQVLRELYSRTLQNDPRQEGGLFVLNDEIKRETPAQRALFEALAGPWMGRDHRRGVPYSWTVGHLADGQGRTSPRSFIAAIRQAVEDTRERYPEHPHALHFESIKRGVQEASAIRVSELTEDYPWVHEVLSPLQGLTVPIKFEDIEQCWEENFPSGPKDADAGGRLPPQHAEKGWAGVRDDLLSVGVFEQRKDGRIDMPDLYRVGFGLGRRGGVKPKK
ncbi:hypothetical protein HVA01_25560 [Halovibrio variabilis]|uniref:Uncharacterized protein n=1 Tax=Halovibrio variabilis TaxID=31910 RepID=A0A511UQQ2_9GAMM|nr:ATP-binding protein [Halovibrio variabilis]GEN28910.1 hypothetical protein HVA01_25560 [Halovibrio variabilis]